MPTATDPEHFRERWYSHIDELQKLKQSLPVEQFDDVDAVIEDAKELVEDGTENVGGE